MYSHLKHLFGLLSKKEHIQIYMVFFLMVLSAMLQVVGVASIVPFIALLSNPEVAYENSYFQAFYNFFGFTDYIEPLIYLGGAVLFTLIISNFLLAANVWVTQKISHSIGRDLSVRLLDCYVTKPYTFFLNANTSELMKNVIGEVGRVVTGVLVPLLQGVARFISAIFILIFLVAVNPTVAVVSIVTLLLVYVSISYIVRKKLTASGEMLSEMSTMKFKSATEILHGIKDLKILGREKFLFDVFQESARKSAECEVYAASVGQIPRYIIETFVFGGILLLVIIMVSSGKSVDQILPLITLYALAGYRMVPALQEGYQSFSRIQYALPALEILVDDLGVDYRLKLGKESHPGDSSVWSNKDRIKFQEKISIERVSFRYPGASTQAISDLSLSIEANKTVGLVGKSGSGKSTVIDILLGLLSPDEGEIKVDGNIITVDNYRALQNIIGYVPQTIYLSDSSVENNIAFGVPDTEIDRGAVIAAAKAARIDEFIQSLPEGYQSIVGDRGARLSGGQRQRIGIARALYHNPDILVLDEATNALDSITEAQVMEEIYSLSGSKTIVMIAHRLSTITNCDSVVFIEDGKVVEVDTYDNLLANNANFMKFVNVND